MGAKWKPLPDTYGIIISLFMSTAWQRLLSDFQLPLPCAVRTHSSPPNFLISSLHQVICIFQLQDPSLDGHSVTLREEKRLYFFSGWAALHREGSCHVQQFPTGSAGVVPLVQGSNGFCCFACPILPQLSFSACFHANQDWIHGTNYLKEFSFNYLRGKRKLLCTPVSRLHIHIQAIPPVLIQ